MVVAKAELAQSYIVQAQMRRLYSCSLAGWDAVMLNVVMVSSLSGITGARCKRHSDETSRL
jgi:hypothetical protein